MPMTGKGRAKFLLKKKTNRVLKLWFPSSRI